MVDILSDQQRAAEQVCLQGIELAEEKDLGGAHALFQKAYEMDPSSAKIMSWYGYTTALVEKKVARGLEFCRKAIDSQIPDAMFYRNIGKLYLLQNNKRGGIAAFSKGLQIDKGNRAILSEWKALGFRRKPILGFLDRGHWLNRKLGQFTWWLAHRNDK
jgi:tetratricopeptide (TPR) repeat protein